MNKRFLDFAGLLLIGDGLLTLIDPRRHCLLWEIGPEPCRKLMDDFVEHPKMSRWVGAAEILSGILLAQAQRPRWSKF
jgi:hypothetical protein